MKLTYLLAVVALSLGQSSFNNTLPNPSSPSENSPSQSNVVSTPISGLRPIVGGWTALTFNEATNLLGDQAFKGVLNTAKQGYSARVNNGMLKCLLEVQRQIVSGVKYRLKFTTDRSDIWITVYQPFSSSAPEVVNVQVA